MGVLAGSAMLAFYPDPYRFDVKGTVVPQALNIRYILNGLRGPMMWSSVVCATYTGVECIVEQMRDESKQSTFVNAGVAGAASGLVMGSMSKRLDIMATTALGLGMLMGLIEFNGQKMQQGPVASSFTSRASIKESEAVQQLKEKYPEYKNM
jgi:hypothetical protein